MKVLITGGAGYIGTTLIRLVLDKGFSVRVFDNLSMGGTALLPFFAHPNFEFMKGDILDKKQLSQALANVDLVIHLAAIVGYPACRKFPELSRQINVVGMKNLCSLADPKTPILFSSTGSTYGKLIGKLCTETSALNPLTHYGKQKAEAEKILQQRGNYVIFRFATAYGLSPRLRLDLLPNDFTYKAVKDKTLIVYEKNFMRTFIHVRDMANAFLFAMEHLNEMKNEIYNVGDETLNLSKEAVCLMIKKHVDYYLHFADVGTDFDQRDYEVSYKKIHQLGYQTQVTFEQGIVEMIHGFEVIETTTPYSNV